ncbi:MAG: citrate synthase [Aeoliella sp.]
MSDVAKLSVGGTEIEIPIVVGTENEQGLEISKLRSATGCVTLDEGFVNTGSTTSAITFLDGEEGVLRYRGYRIEELAADADFIEIAYLLMQGELPSQSELSAKQANMRSMRTIPQSVADVIASFPRDTHPMAIVMAAVVALSAHHQKRLDPADPEQVADATNRLLAEMPTIAAYTYRHTTGQPFVPPTDDLDYCNNFLHMMFGKPGEVYEIADELAEALDMLLIVHADHEQNCSTSTVRMVGSGDANLYASIAAGIGALWGPLHGGANEACVAMLEKIREEGGDVGRYVALVKDKSSKIRLMGFGHRVYKSYDPRAKIVKEACDKVLAKLKIDDPVFPIAQELERVAITDEYFVKRNLYPNVDFYSGVLYRAMGIPANMFTVLFAMGRMPGWLAHWIEMRTSPGKRIARPRQIYTGETTRKFVPIAKR